MRVIHRQSYLLKERNRCERLHAVPRARTRRVRVTYCFGYRLQLVLAGFKATAVLFFFFPPSFFFLISPSLVWKYVSVSCLQLYPTLSSAIQEIIISLRSRTPSENDTIREGDTLCVLVILFIPRLSAQTSTDSHTK